MQAESQPRAAPARSAGVRALLWMLRICGVGAAVAAGLLLAILATEHLPSGPARQHLQQSFNEGALQDQDWPPSDRTIGINQFNDCLLVMMLRFRTSPWHSAVSPNVVFNGLPTTLKDAEGKRVSQCAIARASVAADNPRQLFEPDYYFPYGRYIHAYRIPFNLLIGYTDVGAIRASYRVLAVLILLAAIAAHLLRLAAARRAADSKRAVTAFCFAGIGAALLLFSGLDLFAQSLTHGPSDILLFSAFAWLSLRRPASKRRSELEAAALGALAFGFDFLHGTLPMMLAILVGCAGLRAFGNTLPVPLFSTVRLVAAFVAGVAAAVAAKLAALVTVEKWTAVPSFFNQVGYRMTGRRMYGAGGEEPSLIDVAWALQASAHNIGWGQKWVAIAAVAAATGFAVFALARAFWGTIDATRRPAILTALASIAVIFAWYALFRNHTALHASFMVRLLAWPIGMGCACLVLALASSRRPGAASQTQG